MNGNASGKHSGRRPANGGDGSLARMGGESANFSAERRSWAWAVTGRLDHRYGPANGLCPSSAPAPLRQQSGQRRTAFQTTVTVE